jgi:DUF1365 family protein
VQTFVTEITNTPWGERHSYVLDKEQDVGTGEESRFRFVKSFHVSPFMEMDVDYDWRFSEPGDVLRVQMTNFHKGTRLFVANLDLKRQELNGGNLARMLLSYPPMTMKAIAAIYWQALRLRVKGARFYTHPAKKTS